MTNTTLQSIAFLFIFSTLLISPTALGVETGLRVKARSAALLAAPNRRAPVVSRLSKGRKMLSTGYKSRGYWEVVTDSEEPVWVSEKDVVEIDVDAVRPSVEEERREKGSGGFKRWVWGFGGSTGSNNGRTFFELNLGVEYFFKPWLGWRNALFYRTVSDIDDSFGLDSSVRGHWKVEGFKASGGLGYRLTTSGSSSPFFEAGVAMGPAGMVFGGGIKYIMHSLVRSGADNELVYSIVLSAGHSMF